MNIIERLDNLLMDNFTEEYLHWRYRKSYILLCTLERELITAKELRFPKDFMETMTYQSVIGYDSTDQKDVFECRISDREYIVDSTTLYEVTYTHLKRVVP